MHETEVGLQAVTVHGRYTCASAPGGPQAPLVVLNTGVGPEGPASTDTNTWDTSKETWDTWAMAALGQLY